MDLEANNEAAKNYLGRLIGDPVPRVRYAAVKVVVLHWENSDRLEDYVTEARKVTSFFKGLNFEAEIWPIPEMNSETELHGFITEQRVLLTRKKTLLKAPCLLIIHYGGHGDKDDDSNYTGPGGPQQRRAVWRA